MSKIDAKKKQELQNIEDKIVNRILINFGIGIAGFVFLWVLWKFNLDKIIVLTSAAVFAVLAVVCFVVSGKKNKAYMPYGIMFTAFTLGALIIKSSYVLSKIIGMERFMYIMQHSELMVRLLNAKNDVMFVALCGGAYLIIMLIVNIVLLIRSKIS